MEWQRHPEIRVVPTSARFRELGDRNAEIPRPLGTTRVACGAASLRSDQGAEVLPATA